RLAATLQTVEPSLIAVAGRYRHLVQCYRTPDASEMQRLARLLDYGEAFDASGWIDSREVFVVPRPGTVSPWSSKATDIAPNCGFDWVARIERGLLVLLRFDAAHGEQGPCSIEALHIHLHDRMTESVIDPEGAARALFEPPSRAGLSRVALGGDARRA